MTLKSPHILQASPNTLRMLENLRHILDSNACNAIQQEFDKNVEALFQLGEEHFQFARHTPKKSWRQRISRFYYGAYNIRRAVELHTEGIYRTDSSDHKNISKIPDTFPNKDKYKSQLSNLREDRNLSDYDHDAVEADLLLTQIDAEELVFNFIMDARSFLNSRGVKI